MKHFNFDLKAFFILTSFGVALAGCGGETNTSGSSISPVEDQGTMVVSQPSLELRVQNGHIELKLDVQDSTGLKHFTVERKQNSDDALSVTDSQAQDIFDILGETPERSYIDTQLSEGAYQYRVQSVYDVGQGEKASENAISNVVLVDEDGTIKVLEPTKVEVMQHPELPHVEFHVKTGNTPFPIELYGYALLRKKESAPADPMYTLLPTRALSEGQDGLILTEKFLEEGATYSFQIYSVYTSSLGKKVFVNPISIPSLKIKNAAPSE